MLAIPVIQLLKDKEHRLNLELLTGDDGVDKKIVIQGGMDPKHLNAKKKLMEKKIYFYLNKFKSRNYIFNLGHGVPKETSPKTVHKLVKVVRSFS